MLAEWDTGTIYLLPQTLQRTKKLSLIELPRKLKRQVEFYTNFLQQNMDEVSLVPSFAVTTTQSSSISFDGIGKRKTPGTSERMSEFLSRLKIRQKDILLK
jgi:hypothetical protein